MRQYTSSMRQLRNALVAWVMTVCAVTTAMAQSDNSIHITIIARGDILPPQVGQYKDNMGKLFMVTIDNIAAEEQYVYFGMQLEYIRDANGMPVTNLQVSTPVDLPVAQPYVIAPGSTMLSDTDLRRLFNHIPTSALKYDHDLLSGIGSSDYGLLPEGRYRARLTAYKYDVTMIDRMTNRITTPIPLNDPVNDGVCEFDVCYRAQAPQLTTPNEAMGRTEAMGIEVIKLPSDNPTFSWTAPIINCAQEQQWRYEMLIKEVMDNGKSLVMSPQEAIDAAGHPYVYRYPALTQEQCMLDYNQLKRMKEGKVYVAQVTATPLGGKLQATDFNYTMIENKGKSNFVVFTLDKSNGFIAPPDTGDDDDDGGEPVVEPGDDDDEDEGDDDDDDDDLNLSLIGIEYEIGEDDVDYVFRNPKLVAPDFTGEANHVVFAGNSVESKWEAPVFVGGKGQQSDKLKFRYRAQLYTYSGFTSVADALEQPPFYDGYVKGPRPEDSGSAKPMPKVGELPADDKETAVDVLEDYIPWTAVGEHVSVGDVLLLRILPECVNEESVRFFDDDANTVIFTYSDKMSDAFGNACGEGSIQENREPISTSSLNGKTIHVGEYDMVVREAKEDKNSHSWSGKGWIAWHPFGENGQKVKLGTEFESIYINSDYIMYDGVVKTEEKDTWKNLKDKATGGGNLVPDDIFTDWGIDNLIGTATPDALKSYVDKDAIEGKVNNLAKKVKASEYYEYIAGGYTVCKELFSGTGTVPDVEVFMPLQVPKDYNPSPIDIQVLSCEFYPTRAFMNLMGMAKLPDNEITDENILMFGAPRICMDPDQMLPGSGNFILLENLTVNDPKSDFSIKFNPPANKEKPEDGCMVSWANNKFSALALDCEIAIPDLVLCDENGVPQEGQVPKIQIKTKLEDWEDWYADVTIAPFAHEDLPGWTFKATNVVLDLSSKQNSTAMKFPGGFNKDHFLKESKTGDNAWKGLYIGDLSVQFPEGFIKNGDQRFKIDGSEMIFDRSGVTCSLGLKDPVNASIDDWALKIERVSIDILQNNFDGCGMKGSIHVPLTDKEDYIAFQCDMLPVKHHHKKYTAGNPNPVEDNSTTFDFLLKIQPTENGENALDGKLNFDFFLATLKLQNKQTYFLLEAIDQGEGKGYDTKVELCMAGEITIGNKEMHEKAEELLKKNPLPFDVSLPGIHFTQMRLSNRERSEEWVYGEAVRKAARDDYEAHKNDKVYAQTYVKNKTFKFGSEQSPCYLDCGNWSVASFDKQIGPFAFGIDDYGFGRIGDSDSIYIDVTGRIGFIVENDNPIVSASTSLRFKATVDVKEKDFSYAGCDFRGCKVDIRTMGMKIYGELNVNDGDSGSGKNGIKDKGYDGKLEFTMPGDFFSIKAEGGYYEHTADAKNASDEDYAWGYFRAALESEALRVDPVVINRIMGGFYFNCQPTEGDSKNDPYGGKPKGKKGPIGVALGVGLSTSAGKETLNADVNLLCVYDRVSHRLSTLMMNGTLHALSDLVTAKVSIVYEHSVMNKEAEEQAAKGAVDAKDAVKEVTKDKYLALNITADAGVDSKAITEKIKGVSSSLEEIKKSMDSFQEDINGIVEKIDMTAPITETASLSTISGDPDKPEGQDDEVKTKKGDAEGASAGKTHVALEFKITWYKDGEKKNKWHLYIGEPEKDKRCYFTFLKFKSKVVTVDIGADAYLCLGNELPNNGALPAIPDKITKFLAGEKKEGVDMGADLGKVEKSRAQATRELLKPGNLKGGVMVGASVWGELSIDLGLIYGGIDALAGFDLSLANYGTTAVCVNSGSRMGHNGWYAMGQLYAYLYANLGVQVKIGKLINEKVSLINAGIGGLLEMGLPSPTWVEGKLRVKMNLLDGLFKIDKKFSFSAGDHCVPFVGNALAGFDMFQDVSLGSDSIYEALCNPELAISLSDAHRMVFNTNTSLGSHYRLVDPSWQAYNANGDSLQSIHNSRTYVFDVEKDPEWNMPKGVDLYDLGTFTTDLLAANKGYLSERYFKLQLEKAVEEKYDDHRTVQSLLRTLGLYYYDRASTVLETSVVKDGKNLDAKKVRELGHAEPYFPASCRVDGISFREDKGTTFHLTNMNLKPGHSYMLLLRGSAYEINNGRRQWVEYYDEERNNEPVNIQWNQTRLWFFRVKSEAEDKVVGDSLRDLTPYVALAYPSVDGTNVQSQKGVTTTAYMDDILKPTIALTRNMQTELPDNTMEWVLDYYKSDNLEKPRNTTTRQAVYKVTGNCYNIEPASAFMRYSPFVSAHTAAGAGYDFSSETYRLRLNHTFKYEGKDSTVALVDLWLNPAPYDVVIKGVKKSDNWMQTTSGAGQLLPYTEPFVGARPWAAPTIAYEQTYNQLRNNGKLSDDMQFIFQNNKYDGTPLRLVDPYLYLAYLSKWTFIGDRAVNAYAFDDVSTPLGSETLIFQKANTVMNAEFLKNDANVRSLYDVRNDFYSTWNNWSYNNADLPEYPLPITLGSVGGPTANNQDDRASTVKPINLKYGETQTYTLSSIVKDYASSYVVASQMSQKLLRESRNLFGAFVSYLKKDDNGRYNGLNDNGFNNYMKLLSDLHRGQYIEVTSGDVTAKVPYYQLPLIFGDCFKRYDYNGKKLNGDERVEYKNVKLNESGRTFKSSIGQKDMTSGLRYWTPLSNLFFFRLLGSSSEGLTTEPRPFVTINNDNMVSGYQSSYENYLRVPWDYFDANKGLKAVTDFRARIYRVDAYDTSTGLYTLSKPDSINKGMGAGPWFKDISINASSSIATNLAEMTEGIAANEQFAATHYEHPVPQALYCDAAKWLYLICSDSVYTVGNKFDGSVITEVWADREFDSGMKYNIQAKKQVKNVKIDPSFANTEIQSTAQWFQQCENLESIVGLKYLNTSKVVDMSAMFWYCPKLKSLDISMFDMSSVRYANSMFSDCPALSSLKMNFDMPKLENMADMFYGCSALQTIDFGTFKGTKVTNVNELFSGCSALKTLHLDKFRPAEVEYATNVFKEMGNRAKGLTIYYSYYLDESIKSQLPSWATLVELDNPVKALHLQNSKGEQILLFISSEAEYKKNTTVSIKGESKTYSNMTVKNVWSADKVMNTGDTPGWNAVKGNLVKVIIDPSFKDAPKSLKNWFSNCTKLTAIEGLKNLRTDNATTLEGMFSGCSKLASIDISSLNLSDAESAANMFNGCTSLTTIEGLSGVELPRDISGMFNGCTNLQLDLNSLNFSRVENISEAFRSCRKITAVDLNLVLTQVKNVSGLFRGCSNLEEVRLILPGDLTDISYMFMDCSKLKEIDFSRLHTERVTNMTAAFRGCSSLQKLKLNQLTIEKCADKLDNLFYNVPKDCHIYMLKSTYDGSQSIRTQLPRNDYQNLHLIGDDAVALKLKKGDNDYKLVFLKKRSNVNYEEGASYQGLRVASVTSAVDFMANDNDLSPWGYDFSITEVEFTSSFAEVNPASTKNWFSNMENLTTVNGLQYLNTSETATMERMFYRCSNLTSVSGLNISESVTNLSQLFYDCKKLKDISFGTVNSSKVTDMSMMFYGCQALEELSLEKFSSASVRDMQRTFDACTNLRTLKLGSSFTAAQVETPDPKNTFRSVHDLLVDLPDANISAVRSSFIDKLGFVDGKTGWIGRASMLEAKKGPQVIWTADNATLTFYYGVPREVGDVFGTKKITKVWSDNDVANTPVNTAAPWTSTMLMSGKNVRVVIDESFKQARPRSTNYWFALYSIASIEGLEYLNTSQVTNMNGMFKACQLTALDFSYFDTNRVISANELFADCTKLKSLKMSNNRVMTVGGNNANPFIFQSYSGKATNAFLNVKDLDITVEPTTSVSTVKNAWVSKLGFIDGTNGRFVTGDKVMQALWTADNATLTFVYRPLYSAGQKFNGKTITNVWSGNGFTGQVTGANQAVQLMNGEYVAEQFITKNWTSTVKGTLTNVVFDASFAEARPSTLRGWFSGLTKLTTIEGMENLNTENVTNLSWLFYNCTSLTSVDLSHFNTDKVISTENMFRRATKLTSLNLSSFNTAKVTNMKGMFRECLNLTSITGCENVKFTNVTDMSYMFYKCSKLDLSAAATLMGGPMLANTGKVTTMSWMFAGNEGTEIYISLMGTGSLTRTKGMFYGCKNLTKLNITKLNTSQVVTMAYMFAECPKLNLNGINDWNKFSTASVTTMEGMFKNCAAMSYLKLTNWNTTKVTNMKDMFSGCKALKTLIVGSNFSVAGMTSNQTGVFTGVTGLYIKMPTAVYNNRSAIFNTKLGFKSTNGYLLNLDN